MKIFVIYRDNEVIGVRFKKELAEACVTVDKRVYANSVYNIKEAAADETYEEGFPNE
jgi:hypothetical protein